MERRLVSVSPHLPSTQRGQRLDAAAASGDAPELIVDVRFNCPDTVHSLVDLRGGAVLLEYWATWCTPCLRQLPHLNELHEKFAERGLIVLGVTEEDVDKVRPWVEKNAPKYPIVIEESAASARAFKLDGIPHACLIDPEGKLAWEGHPEQLDANTIERVLVDAVPLFAKLADDLEPVQTLLDQQQPGKAMTLLTSLEQGGKLDAKAAKLAVLTRQRLERQASAMLDEAKKWREKKKVCDTAIVLHQVAARYDGGPPAEEAQRILKEMSKNSADKREIEASLPVAKARMLEAQKKYDEAWTQYKAATLYGRSEADAKARRAMDDLDRMGLRGFKSDCTDCVKTGKACKKHAKK